MLKWRLLVGVCSLALLCWSIVEFINDYQSVGATGDPYAGWVFLCLAAAGLITLYSSRLGYLAAVVELVATAYAAWVCVIAFTLWRTVTITHLYLVPPVLLSIAVPVVLLCAANAVGTWQIARFKGHSVTRLRVPSES